MNKKIESNIFLFLTAIIWGFAFVAQRSVMEHMPPFFYSGIRMYVGTLSLLIVIYFAYKFPKFQKVIGGDPVDENGLPYSKQQQKKFLVKAGIYFGAVMFFAANLQQVGLVFTTASKTGFITTLYIVLVPLMGIFLKHKTTTNTWIGVALATIGLYLLCITESFTITFGDFIVLIGALFWAIQILLMDNYVKKLMVMKIVAVQFFVSGTLSFIASPFIDPFFATPINLEGIVHAIPSILYVGVLSTAGAATFQGLGQRHANPATASIILSMESVFGVIFGFLVMHETLTPRESIGCILMFLAILIVQRPVKKRNDIKRGGRAAKESAGSGASGEKHSEIERGTFDHAVSGEICDNIENKACGNAESDGVCGDIESTMPSDTERTDG